MFIWIETLCGDDQAMHGEAIHHLLLERMAAQFENRVERGNLKLESF